MITKCVYGVKYAVVGTDGSLEWKRQPVESSEEDMNVIMEQVNEYVI